MDFYAWIDRDLNRLRRVNILIGSILFLVTSFLIFLGFYVVWSIRLEDYCEQKAKQIVGDKWATFLDPNPEEYGYIPQGGKIALGFREQLKCERNTSLFHNLH